MIDCCFKKWNQLFFAASMLRKIEAWTGRILFFETSKVKDDVQARRATRAIGFISEVDLLLLTWYKKNKIKIS